MTATYAAWVALASPLAGLAFTIAIGSSVSRRTVGVIASGAILGGFVASCVALVSLLRRSPGQRVELSTGWHWLSAGRFDSHVSSRSRSSIFRALRTPSFVKLARSVATTSSTSSGRYSAGLNGGDWPFRTTSFPTASFLSIAACASWICSSS